MMDPETSKAEEAEGTKSQSDDVNAAGPSNATPPPSYLEVQNTVQPSCPPEDQSAIDIPTTVSQGDPVTQQPISILEDEGTLPPRHVEYTEEMQEFIEDDSRCDCDKTDSCRRCGEECDVNCNEAFLCTGECATKELKFKMLIAPFWIFCNMKTLIPCVKIFKDHETLNNLNGTDLRKNDVMREARDIILQTAPLWMSKRFEILWAGLMCVVLLICTVCNIVMVATDTIFILSSWVIFGVILLAFFLWVGLLAFLLYRKFKKASVRPARWVRSNRPNNQNNVSVSNRRPVGRLILFQLISEACLYPQVILSLRMAELNRPILASVTLSLLTLLIVWVLRIVICNAYKVHLHSLFSWVVFVTVGSYLQVLSLLVGLFLLAFNNESSYYTDIVIPVVMALTPSFNYLMFYIGYMYDIMLHAAALSHSNSDEEEIKDHAIELFQRLQDLPTFHKTFLAMSHYWSGVIAYFWMIPSVLLALVMVFQFDDGLIDMVVVTSIYFVLNVIIHHRAVLVSMSAHFMVACICGFVFALCTYCAGVLMAVVSIGLFILAAHIVMFISACISSMQSSVARQEEVDNRVHREHMRELNRHGYY